MKLQDLVHTSSAVGRERGRLKKIALLSDILSRAERSEVPIVVDYLAGTLPQGRIGIGPAALREARPTDAATDPILSLPEVDAELTRIAQVSGKGSTGERVHRLRELLRRGTRDEQEFLVKLLHGELRQGALEGVMVEAVARASGIDVRRIRRAAMASGRVPEVASAALLEGEAGLDRFGIEVFRPVQPMLATPAEDAAQAMTRLGEAALEYKLDGARVQIHKSDDVVRVYSRTLREVTPAVPEVVELVSALPARRLILDGEVIALRPDGTPHPFQVTMRRFGRKLDLDTLRRQLPLTPVLFDLLLLDDDTLIDQPQFRRFRALVDIGAEHVVPHHVAQNETEAMEFLTRSLDAGHEGAMAKSLEAAYEAGSRGFAWLKLKSAHTLDLVVLAAEWGSGRRKGWLSNLHLGARDPNDGGFVMLGKTFKGLTDRLLEWQTQKFLELEIGRDDYTVYLRPELVVEIAFNDVQTSPHYPGGLALRFARVKRYRSDKTPDEADTIETVREIHTRTA